MQHADRSTLLGTMNMRRLVPKVSVPIMISMIVQALYNIVDSYYISQFDQNGLTAVSLAAPFQMLMIALSTGMGTGINSLISRRLGERLPDQARRDSAEKTAETFKELLGPLEESLTENAPKIEE